MPIRRLASILALICTLAISSGLMTVAGPSRAAAPGAAGAAPSDSGAVRHASPELFLAWRAPHGMPGAVTNVPLRGGEGAKPETLYLAFDPGRDAETFFGMAVTLEFSPAEGDTLGTLWRFGGGTLNRRNVQIEFPSDSSWGLPRAFKTPGFGAPNYRFHDDGGTLQIIYAVPAEQAGPIRGGQRYVFARVLFPAGSTLDDGDGQPVCVDWWRGELGFSLEGEGTSVMGRPVERFVSVNSPRAGVCNRHRGSPGPWTPGADRPR